MILELLARALGWQEAHDDLDGRLVVYHDGKGIHCYSWREAVEISMEGNAS